MVQLCRKNKVDAMKKEIEIVPKGKVYLSNGENAVVGEAVVVKNLRECDGALQVVGKCKKIGSLPDGERLVLVDESELGVRLITASSDGDLRWAGDIVDGTLVTQGENGVTIAQSVGNVTKAVSCGKYIVVSTDAGIKVFRRAVEGYEQFDVGEVMPQIMLSAIEETLVTHRMEAYEFSQTYSSWTALSEEDAAGVGRQLRSAMLAMRSEAKNAGRLSGAVMVRCGIRLYDDSYVWFGCPTLIGVEQSRNATDWVNRLVVSGSDGIKGVNSAQATLATYRLGITPITAFPEKWDGVIKSVDILVSEEMQFADLSADMELRCATTTSSGIRTQLLMVSPRSVGNDVITDKAINVDKWHCVSSTTDFGSLRQGKWIASGSVNSSEKIIPGFATFSVQNNIGATTNVVDNVCNDVMRLSGVNVHCAGIASGCGRVYGANLTLDHTMQWSVAGWLGGQYSSDACVAAVEVALHTDEGVKTLSTWENLPFTPVAVSPIVSFPDARAVYVKIWLQGGGNVMEWESGMTPDTNGSKAVAVNGNLTFQPLVDSGKELIDLPEKTCWQEHLYGSIITSSKGNPFVWSVNNCAEGMAIDAVAVSVRPIYSGGIGRYPLYLFCSDGLYALPQLTNAEYGGMRLISRRRISPVVMLCEAGDAVAFMAKDGDLLSLSGTKLNVLQKSCFAKSLAWNGKREELWLQKTDNTIEVMLPSGRIYLREEKPEWLYSNGETALFASGNEVLDIMQEETCGRMPVEWMSHPIVVDGKMRGAVRSVTWSVFSDEADLALAIYGERGASCHGYRISSLKVKGVVGAPVEQRVLAQHLRSVRLRVCGNLNVGDFIRPVEVRLLD